MLMKKTIILSTLIASLSVWGQEKKLNLNIRPRVNFSNAKFDIISSGIANKLDVKPSLGLGIEVEQIVAKNNKWALTFEPTYHYANGSLTAIDENYSNERMTYTMNYKAVDLPIGIRHYMFLNDKSSFYLDGQFSFNINLNSNFIFVDSSGKERRNLKLYSTPNFNLGFGYKYNNKYGVQIRYSSARSLTGKYLNWLSDYNSLSFILSYNIL